MNPYLFIVGCPRSGTTLLQRILNAHPDIAIPSREQHWIPKLVRRGRLAADGSVTQELYAELREDERFRGLLPNAGVLRALEAELPLSYARFVARAFDLHGELQGKQLVGEKTPGHVRYIALLRELWPDARFVHLIRDGRDVALSLRDWRPQKRPGRQLASWADDPVTTAGLVWERLVRAGLDAGRGDGRYQEVRYEDLVANPKREAAALGEYLGVAFDPRMLRFYEGREQTDRELSAKKAWRPVTAGLRDWRTEMPDEDAEAFEAVAGELLEELGYERTVAQPSARARARGQRVRALAEGWLEPASARVGPGPG